MDRKKDFWLTVKIKGTAQVWHRLERGSLLRINREKLRRSNADSPG